MMEGITWETEEVELKQVFQTTAVTEKKKKVTWCIAWRLSVPVSRSSHESCTMRYVLRGISTLYLGIRFKDLQRVKVHHALGVSQELYYPGCKKCIARCTTIDE